MNRLRLWCIVASLALLCACSPKEIWVGETHIAQWPYGKKGAISPTYDDGSINQFRQALPMMNRLKLPATFFIITGQIPGSQYTGKFIGRSVQEIIKEATQTPTNQTNFFERASAAAFLGYQGTVDYHSKAGSLYEAGKVKEAYEVMDDLYRKVKNGGLKPGNTPNLEVEQAKGVTWDDIRTYAAQGHEFASHTITHPRLAVLDEANLLYELEKSREDILKQLGPTYTFSAEGPYGTENERVITYAHPIYPALRNRMPAPYLAELNRASDKQPGSISQEYVQWQRGATTKTPLPQMQSWVDTVAAHDNIWLVLVIHGVDSIGWEALPHELLDTYFSYIKSKEAQLWVGTFGQVTKYIRERMSAKVQTQTKNGSMEVQLTHSLDKAMYDVPLTLKTYVPSDWKTVKVKQGKAEQQVTVQQDQKGNYILYQATPNAEPVGLSQGC